MVMDDQKGYINYVKYAMAKSIDEPWVTPDSTGHACS